MRRSLKVQLLQLHTIRHCLCKNVNAVDLQKLDSIILSASDIFSVVFNGHSYPCHVCGKEFDKQNSLLMHLLRVHKTGSNIRKGYRKPPGEKTTYRRRRQVHSNIPPLPAAVEFQQNSAEEEFADPEEESYCEDDGIEEIVMPKCVSCI